MYNTSLVFNYGIQELCKTLPDCYACDFSEDFAYSSDLFANDGLHLNSKGKSVLAFSLHRYLVESFNSRNKTKTSPVRRIPKELKILHPPRKCKVHRKPWQETNLDLVIYLRRERQSTKCPHTHSHRKPRRRRVNPDRGADRDGFVKPQHFISIPPPPQLPPNRHVGEKIPAYIPYVDLDTLSVSKEWSRCPIPAPVKPFIRKKKLGKRKQRQRRRKRRKKVQT